MACEYVALANGGFIDYQGLGRLTALGDNTVAYGISSHILSGGEKSKKSWIPEVALAQEPMPPRL